MICLAAATWMIATAAACRSGDGPPADGRTATWLDISPAIGDPPRDPGDALALLQAYGSGTLGVRGVSVSFGNVPLERGYLAAQELLERLDSGLLRAWRGASAPDERAAPTEATAMLEEALGKEQLTIVTTGPVTTVASVLLRKPAMAGRIQRVILIAGHAEDAVTAGRASMNATDANVDADAPSLQVLLESPVALTLVSPSLSTDVRLDASDLDRLDEGHGPVELITPPAREWLRATARAGSEAAFPVPAMLAVDVAAHPGTMRCEAAIASFMSSGAARPRLIVRNGPGGRRVTWCHTADSGIKDRMLADVLRIQPLRP